MLAVMLPAMVTSLLTWKVRSPDSFVVAGFRKSTEPVPVIST